MTKFEAVVHGLDSPTPDAHELAQLLRPYDFSWFQVYPSESDVMEDNMYADIDEFLDQEEYDSFPSEGAESLVEEVDMETDSEPSSEEEDESDEDSVYIPSAPDAFETDVMGEAQTLLMGLGTQLPNQTDGRRFLTRLGVCVSDRATETFLRMYDGYGA